jgi:tetratricopeptide (TPR) repeat protein
VLLVLVTATPAAIAFQSDGTSKATAAAKNDLEEIGKLSKSATTAPEFARLVELCDQVLPSAPSDQDRAFVESMKSWALNRRGELRLELFDQLAGIQNQSQSALVLEQAASDFELSTKLDDQRWRAWLGRGIVSFQAGDLTQAQAHFRRVGELQPQRAVGFFNAAEIEYALGEYATALKDYEKALELDAEDVQAMTGVAHCLRRLERLEEARAAYKRMVSAAAENPNAHEQFGEFLTSNGEWRASIESFEKATRLGSKTANLRLCEILLNCPDEKMRDIPRGVELVSKMRETDAEILAQLRIPTDQLVSLGIEQDSTQTAGQNSPADDSSSGFQPLTPIRKD